MQLLERKLLIPPVPSFLVSRPRLLERLDEWMRKHLTLILAPAGFGKTTLLCEWVAKREHKVQVVWVSLGKEDNDSSRFWQYVVAAINPMANKALNGWLQNSPVPTVEEIEKLINWIHKHVRQDFMLVLDDYHVISSPEINNSVSYLLDYLPSNMRVAIISRSHPHLPIAQMRARDQLLEFTKDDLKFTYEEADLYLGLFELKNLSPGEIKKLNTLAEGWAVGLQIAAITLRDADQSTSRQLLGHFSGAHYCLDEYFLEQIFQNQKPDVQEFLLSTSILERFNRSLCSAVTGMIASGEILDQLERDNLFLVRLDNTREWYRYHHLFADFLKNKLRQEHAGKFAVFHGRAAVWFEKDGNLESAMEHALDGSEHELADRIIQKVEEKLWGRNEIKTLGRWFSTLPAEYVKSRPALYCGVAWTIALSGDLEKLVPNLAQMEADSKNLGNKPRQTDVDPGLMRARFSAESYQCYINLLHAYHALYQGNMQRAFPFLEHALELTRENDHCWERSVVLYYMGQYFFWNYKLDEAIRMFTAAADASHKLGHRIVHISSLSSIAAIHLILGKISHAEQYYQRTFEYVADINTEIYTAVNYFGLNDVRLMKNQVDEAIKDADHYLGLSEVSGRTVDLIVAHIGFSRLKQVLGDVDEAQAHLKKAHQLAFHRNVYLLDDFTQLWRARLSLMTGDLTTAAHFLQNGHVSVPLLNEFRDLTFSRYLLAAGRGDDAVHLLNRILKEAQAGGRTGITLEVKALLALAYQQCKNQDMAVKILEELLLITKSEGYMRLFIDEGEKMKALLLETLRQNPRLLDDVILNKHVNQVLDAFATKTGSKTQIASSTDETKNTSKSNHAPLIEALSGREMQVLALIGNGKSYDQIANELFVALSTVQWHVKNIYRKLSVHSGTEAVATARALGIL